MKTPPSEIVILNDYASATGGSTGVALASAIGLASRGLAVTFFSCVGPVAPALRGVPNLSVICLGQPDIGGDPHRLRAFVGGWRNGRAVQALRALLAGKPRDSTLVHAHTWSQALSPFALSAVRRMGFRLVITLHDFFVACPNGQFFVYPRQEICGRVPLSAACWRCNCDRRHYGHKLWRNARSILQNRWLRVPARASCFIGVSPSSLRVLRPYLPRGTPMRVVHNPVAAVREEPAPARSNREFLFVGRFEPEKGALLLAAAAREAGVPVTFVGDGSLRPRLEAACPDSRFTGWLPREEIHRRLRRARALVFPSLWYETLGLVVLEALAAGVPTIVSDRGAAADIVVHNFNGRHFCHGLPASLGGQMAALARDDEETARLGRNAHELYWRLPWTPERHVAELLEVYAEVAGQGRPSHQGESPHESPDRLGTGR